MSLETLPEELLIIICKKLDTVALANLYNASLRIRSIVRFCNVKMCNFSVNTLATKQIFLTSFFRILAPNLYELNLCGIHDLCKTALMPAMKRLKSLNSLDVSYTNINILDFIQMYAICPTIKNININFSFGKSKLYKIPGALLSKCQDVFKNLECVHFVGDPKLLFYTNVTIAILSKAKLKILQFTTVEIKTHVMSFIYHYETTAVNFDHLCICITNSFRRYTVDCIKILETLDFKEYEYIIINNLYSSSKILVHATPIFRSFVLVNFNIKANPITDVQMIGNACIMLWKKDSIAFDDKFFDILYKKIKRFFPLCFVKEVTPENALKYDWFVVYPQEEYKDIEYEDMQEVGLKKRRGIPNFVLNFDRQLEGKKNFEFTMTFVSTMAYCAALSENCKYLSNLTYLSLISSPRYSADFFKIIFKCCDKLVTINIEAPFITSFMPLISMSVPLSKTIRNFRLAGQGIDIRSFITSLSKCSTLENIHIINLRGGNDYECYDPTALIKNCSNLCCVYTYYNVTENNYRAQLRLINQAKEKSKKMHIKFKIGAPTYYYDTDALNITDFCYDPYVDVFKLTAVRPMKLF